MQHLRSSSHMIIDYLERIEITNIKHPETV
jgi:hypothetical protein